MKKITLIILTFFLLTSCNNTKVIEENNETKTNIEKSNILALGDSLTAGYNLEYSDSYPAQLENKLEKENYNYKVINAGVSGDTSKNLLSRIDLYTEDYEIVLLNIGGNDGLRSLDTNDLKDNIITITDKFPDSEIVLFSIDLPGNYSVLYRNKLKNVYEEIANDENIHYYGLFFEGLDHSKHFLSDKIHPNKEGYEIISENIMEYLIENKLIKND